MLSCSRQIGNSGFEYHHQPQLRDKIQNLQSVCVLVKIAMVGWAHLGFQPVCECSKDCYMGVQLDLPWTIEHNVVLLSIALCDIQNDLYPHGQCILYSSLDLVCIILITFGHWKDLGR